MGMLDAEHVTQEGAEGSLFPETGETVPSADVAAGSDESAVEIDGERYTLAQLKEAVEALRARDQWESAYKQRDQKFAKVRDVVEAAFGKKIKDLTDADLYDLRAFGLFNLKLQTDAQFRNKWLRTLTEALTGEYEQAGMAPREAARRAQADVRAAAAAQASGDQDALQRLEARLANLERSLTAREQAMQQEQALAELQEHVGATLDDAVKKAAADMPGYHLFLKRHILYYLDGYSDAELAEMAESGELERLIAGLAKQGVQLVKESQEAALKERARAMAEKDNAPPTPMKGSGGVGEQTAKGIEPRRGAGLSQMTRRMMEALGKS